MKRTASSTSLTIRAARRATIGLLALAVCGVVLLASAASPRSEAAAPPAKRPNILFILADDMGYSDISAFGSEIPTPNLDALAKAGMVLSDFHANMSCQPTRAMFMSGMDNHRAGIGVQGTARDNQKGKPGYEGYLNFRVASVAELMTDAGYNTYMAGKWHLGTTVETGPHARGFKRVFASMDGAAHLGSWDWRGPQKARFWDGDDLVNVGDEWYSTRGYTNKIIDYIERDRADGKPFFAWLAYTAPHWPLQAPKQSIAKFKGWYDAGYEATYAKRFARQKKLGLVPKDAKPIDDARFRPRWSELTPEQKAIEARHMEIYAAMVSDLDSYVGELVAYLKKIGEFDNTFIMFMSDNGPESSRMDQGRNIVEQVGKAYDHSLDNLGSSTSYINYGANWASVSATPLNRHKASSFEGGNREPAFAYFPKLIKGGTKSAATGTIMDLLPTFLDLAGTRHPGTRFRDRDVLPPQGKSLLPLLSGKSKTIHGEDAVFAFELLGQRSVRQGDWKIVWDARLPAAQRRWQLFNLREDIGEQLDLAQQQPARVAELVRHWDHFVEENGVILAETPAGRSGAPAGRSGAPPAGRSGAPPAGRSGAPPAR